jgi:hypothetical protein
MFLAESHALDFTTTPLGIEVFLYMRLTCPDPQWITVFLELPLEEPTAPPLMRIGV